LTQNDSFIHEVTEEVRRDKLFGVFKKYGWILGLVLVAIVGGAGVNEWLKARAQATAEKMGDAMLAAIALPDQAAQAAELTKLAEGAGKAAVLAKFQAAASLHQAGDTAGAAAILDTLAASTDNPVIFRDMAKLKSVMIQGSAMLTTDRVAALDSLSAAGMPLRMLALEQRALVHIENGDKDAALADLMVVFESSEASQGSQQRTGQLIIALGGELPQGEPIKVQ
jgi:hypothetical protein